MALSSSAEQVHRTNTTSKFTEWRLELKNGATLTGIAYIPPKASSSIENRPLLVAIHGATCSAYNFDVSPEYTASIDADLHDIPVVAFNRPNYLTSSGWLVDRSSDSPPATRFKAAEGLTYFEEEARWFHEFIFPAIFEKFALPNGCSSIVTNSHSMCVPTTIIAAASYCNSPATAGYVWTGVVLTGLSVELTAVFLSTVGKKQTGDYHPTELPYGQDSSIHASPFTEKDKTDLMLGPPGLSDPALRPLIWKQNTPYSIDEAIHLATIWPASRERYQASVKIPVLYALGEYDWIWKGTQENVSAFSSGFTASPRVEGAVVEGACHAIELSTASRGWWNRVFGWAIEVDAGHRSRSANIEKYF